ncbi:hypothetical protein Dimus_000643 [Dionaea muscipula]
MAFIAPNNPRSPLLPPIFLSLSPHTICCCACASASVLFSLSLSLTSKQTSIVIHFLVFCMLHLSLQNTSPLLLYCTAHFTIFFVHNRSTVVLLVQQLCWVQNGIPFLPSKSRLSTGAWFYLCFDYEVENLITSAPSGYKDDNALPPPGKLFVAQAS